MLSHLVQRWQPIHSYESFSRGHTWLKSLGEPPHASASFLTWVLLQWRQVSGCMMGTSCWRIHLVAGADFLLVGDKVSESYDSSDLPHVIETNRSCSDDKKNHLWGVWCSNNVFTIGKIIFGHVSIRWCCLRLQYWVWMLHQHCPTAQHCSQGLASQWLTVCSNYVPTRTRHAATHWQGCGCLLKFISVNVSWGRRCIRHDCKVSVIHKCVLWVRLSLQKSLCCSFRLLLLSVLKCSCYC